MVSVAFEGTNALRILDDCAALKDVKGRTEELAKLGFVSVWVLTQQLSSIANPFRDNVAAIVFFLYVIGKDHEGHLRRIRGRTFT